MKTVRDTVNLDFRRCDLQGDSLSAFIQKVMETLQTLPLPVPSQIIQADKSAIKISGYSDSKIVDAVRSEFERRQLPLVLNDPSSEYSVSLSTGIKDFNLIISLPGEEARSPIIGQAERIFRALCSVLTPEVGCCYLSDARWEIRQKYFEWEIRTTHFSFFGWLNYFNAKEFARQGGEVIFQNAYIKAERLSEGVLIQVGESPFDAHTPEGEELIVKATRALPPVVKD